MVSTVREMIEKLLIFCGRRHALGPKDIIVARGKKKFVIKFNGGGGPVSFDYPPEVEEKWKKNNNQIEGGDDGS